MDQTDQTDDTASTRRDAGSRDAGRGRDAKVDAAPPDDSTDDVDADVVDDPPADEEDAGLPVATRDAGKDAAVIKDAATHDAGRTSDAGSVGTPDAGTSVCDQLTYATFGQQFMSNYCVSCHGGLFAQSGVRLDTLSGITSAKSKVKSAAVTGSSMPPFGSKAPSSAERKQLGQWLDCGPK